ncbi:uncharacterized protein Tco025E_02308 [Trypanosoma conorhini]|uniref:Uncharacterized protein n=1 Tax=Trypanosoma conorhini TaxID=83891 RepID=A0A422Q581_9TRYP|nr:uncharacterized protein Tco025E_02308 [Trypanosoma conorhini]RNF25114.1 hypothetical protein Tco025E_02308 [Trypanosoma conorhini]
MIVFRFTLLPSHLRRRKLLGREKTSGAVASPSLPATPLRGGGESHPPPFTQPAVICPPSAASPPHLEPATATATAEGKRRNGDLAGGRFAHSSHGLAGPLAPSRRVLRAAAAPPPSCSIGAL